MADIERFPGVAVIGGGVVGLAIAERFARTREVVVLESEAATGLHTSSRHSGVIHAGIYYSPESLKARFCVSGNTELYSYSEDKGIPHQRIGKVIIATTENDIPRLSVLYERAKANGVHDLEWLNQAEVRDREPAVRGVAGLWSPSTGIIDSHEYMEALKRDIKAHGGIIAIASPVSGGTVKDNGIALTFGRREQETVLFDVVINSTGLWAQQVARTIQGFPQDLIPPIYYAKGHYYELRGEIPFRHLVYPIPEPQLHGLGTHFTVDTSGRGRFGPDVLYVDSVDYSDATFTRERELAFNEAVRKYWPELPDDALSPGYVGVRPKLGEPGSPEQDFFIKGQEDFGLPMVLLCGIESPGLTAAPAIAEYVVNLVSGI